MHATVAVRGPWGDARKDFRQSINCCASFRLVIRSRIARYLVRRRSSSTAGGHVWRPLWRSCMSTTSLRRTGKIGSVLAFLALFSLSTAAVAQVATGSIVGTVVDSSGQVVPGASVTVRNVNQNTTTTLTSDATGVFTALVPGAGHLRGVGRVAGLQDVGTPRDRAAGERSAQNRCHAGGGGADGRDDRDCRVAARAHRLVRGRDRDRGEGDQGTAVERPQFRDARLPRAGHHAGAGGREPVRRQHLQSARRVELQRARQSGQLQRVAHRRHRQQRIHVQHRHRRPLGRTGP